MQLSHRQTVSRFAYHASAVQLRCTALAIAEAALIIIAQSGQITAHAAQLTHFD